MSHKEIHEEAGSHLHPRSYDPLTATAMQLSAIYQLLDERLPEKPMAVYNPLSDGGMTFYCQSHNADTLTVREISGGRYEVYAFMEVDDAETVINLSSADAKRLARAILGST